MRTVLGLILLALVAPVAGAEIPTTSMDAAGHMEDACNTFAAIHVTGYAGGYSWTYVVEVTTASAPACGGTATYRSVYRTAMAYGWPACVTDGASTFCINGPYGFINPPPTPWDVTYTNGAYHGEGQIIGVLASTMTY